MSTLKENGYEVVDSLLFYHFLNCFHIEPFVIKWITTSSKDEDVFKTTDGDVKQIQNLHKIENEIGRTFIKLSEGIKEVLRIEGDVINMQFFIKPPGYKMTAPHQDGVYFDAPNDEIITCWIPLQNVDESNSCMYYYPHKIDGVLDHEEIGSVVRERSGKVGKSLYHSDTELDQYVPVPMTKHQILVHDQFTLHYSSPNTSDQTRIALTCIFKVNKHY